MKVEVITTIRGKLYSSGRLPTESLMNYVYGSAMNDPRSPTASYTKLSDWLSAGFKDFRKLHAMYRDNRQVFLREFGKPRFHFRSEFDYHCWPVKISEKDREVSILLMTARAKGTCIEVIVTKEPPDEELLIKFLSRLSKLKG